MREGRMLTHTVYEKSGIVEIVIDGQVDPADYDAAITAIDAMIERHGTVKVLEVLKNIGWVDPSIWWKDTIWGLPRLRDFGSRSEERRGGKECVGQGRSRWWQYH